MKKKPILNSNDLKSTINKVCYECGVTANILTCLRLYGKPPLKLAFTCSTYGEAKCDFCKKKKAVTEARDFFYPDFGLIERVVKTLSKPNKPG